MLNHEIVIHLAAKIDVGESIKNPDFTKKELDSIPKISLKEGLKDLLQSDSF